MSLLKAFVLGMLIPVSLAAPLLAQDRPDARMIFEQVDLNGDGQVTLDELQGVPAARFARMDTDADGTLSRDELIAARQQRHAARIDGLLERADADDDGALSMEEMMAARPEGRGRQGNPERMFDRLDADANGSVTQAEFDEAMTAMRERRGDHGQRHRG